MQAGIRIPVVAGTIGPSLVVADVIADPPRTRILADAAKAGARTLDGQGMLVNQAVIGIEYWTGIRVDPAIMRKTLAGIFGG